MLLDKFMPVYHFNEVHLMVIHAPASSIFKSLYELTPADIQLLRILFGLRALPSRLIGRQESPFAGTQPLLDQMFNNGFVSLAEEMYLILPPAGNLPFTGESFTRAVP